MELEQAKILVIGGAGFIGSFVVTELLKHPVKEVVVYDNLARGKKAYLTEAFKDPRCSFYPVGGDIREIDILNDAMKGKDYVICLAAMWLLHCKDYPRTAFDVNIAGTFNVLEACVKNNIKKLIWSSSASVYGDAVELPMTEDHPFNNKNFYGATKIAGEAMATAFHDRSRREGPSQRDFTHRDKSKRPGLASTEGPNCSRHTLTEKIQHRSTYLLPQHEPVVGLDESALWQLSDSVL